MAPTIFLAKDFSRILNDVQGYGTIFLDRIREKQWYDLAYDNSDVLIPFTAQTWRGSFI